MARGENRASQNFGGLEQLYSTTFMQPGTRLWSSSGSRRISPISRCCFAGPPPVAIKRPLYYDFIHWTFGLRDDAGVASEELGGELPRPKNSLRLVDLIGTRAQIRYVGTVACVALR